MRDETKFSARSSVEALRAGVPNSYSVRVLGCDQPKVEQVFGDRLDAVIRSQTYNGFLIKGDFGTGKSHTLGYLAELALERNFAVSRVYVNKETPLHDPVKMYQGAVESITLPKRAGPAFNEIANQLVFQSAAYREFERWTNQASNGMDPRFAASLFLFEHFQADHEFRDQIIRFWAGGKIAATALKSRMRQAGVPYVAGYTSQRELAAQRFQFAGRLIRAAGYAGWVLLVDEVELLGTYSALQRGKSYVEIARLMNSKAEPGLPVLPVLAITGDYTRAVLEEKDDWTRIPKLMKSRAAYAGTGEDVLAEAGMRILAGNGYTLKRPDLAALDDTFARIRGLYKTAYDWEPAVTTPLRREQSTPLRAYIRRWITEWDLRRLHPGEAVELETAEWHTDYRDSERSNSKHTGRSDQSLIDDVLGDIA